MNMTFCNKCAKPIIEGKHYQLQATCFLDEKVEGETKQLDLCEECYNTITPSHYKAKVLEEGAKWLRKRFG